jgi:hypothetical protein
MMKKVLLALIALEVVRQLASASTAHPASAFVVWAGLPVAAWLLGPGPLAWALSHKGKHVAGWALILLSIGLALLFLGNFDHFRDQFGKNHIAGYSATYSGDYDDFGRPQRAAQVNTSSFRTRLGLWFGELAFVIMVIGFPALTWKAAHKFLPLDAPQTKS